MLMFCILYCLQKNLKLGLWCQFGRTTLCVDTIWILGHVGELPLLFVVMLSHPADFLI